MPSAKWQPCCLGVNTSILFEDLIFRDVQWQKYSFCNKYKNKPPEARFYSIVSPYK